MNNKVGLVLALALALSLAALGGYLAESLSGGETGAALGNIAPGSPGVVRIDPSAEQGAGSKPTGLKTLRAGAGAVTGCGSERAAVKHLTDGFVLPSQPTVMTIDQLVGMAAPPVGTNSLRFPVERQLIELRGVHVIGVKQEADSDLHVIVATATGAELNVEAPMAACDSASPYAAQLARARAAMNAAMPNVSSSTYTAVNLTATIEGMLFFDVLHGQRGAPNGIELHPVLFFATGSAPPPPPVTTTTVTTTTVATTTVATTTTTPVLTGCKRWPGRHWLHHVYHRECRPDYYKTP